MKKDCKEEIKEGDELAPAPDMTPLVFDERYDTRILVVRHGESIANSKHMAIGHTDWDLSERGYAQAERTAEFLANTHIDAVYSSDLMRAFNTAVPHAKARGLTVIPDRNLRELYLGAWEGFEAAWLLENEYERYGLGFRGKFFGFRFPEGDSVDERGEIFLSALYRIAKENRGKTVLVAGHSAALRSAWGRLCGICDGEKLPFSDNASVSVLYFDGERLIPGEYSHSAHLAGV